MFSLMIIISLGTKVFFRVVGTSRVTMLIPIICMICSWLRVLAYFMSKGLCFYDTSTKSVDFLIEINSILPHNNSVFLLDLK